MEPQELKTPCCILCLELLADPGLLSSEKKNNEWITLLSLKALQSAEHAISFWFSFSGKRGKEMEEELGNLARGNVSLTLIPCFCCWVISWLPAVYLAINRIHCLAQELWVVGSSAHGAVDSVCWCWRIGCSCEERALNLGMYSSQRYAQALGLPASGCDVRYSSLLRAFLLTSLQARQMCGYLPAVTPGRKPDWIS